jgi:hypothetical protein
VRVVLVQRIVNQVARSGDTPYAPAPRAMSRLETNDSLIASRSPGPF